MWVLLGQVLHRIRHFKRRFLGQEPISCFFLVYSFPPYATAHQHQGCEEDHSNCSWAWGRTPPVDYPLLGVAISIGNSWGPLKQTNKQGWYFYQVSWELDKNSGSFIIGQFLNVSPFLLAGRRPAKTLSSESWGSVYVAYFFTRMRSKVRQKTYCKIEVYVSYYFTERDQKWDAI